MANDRAFVNYLLELLTPLDGITAKRMFGSDGLFRDGLMFAIVADDTLYFKTDSQTLAPFIERELEPFTFFKKGEEIRTSYYRAPEEALDNSEEMCVWAAQAHSVALRAVKPKRAPKRSSQ